MQTTAFIVLALLLVNSLGAIVGSYIDENGLPIDHHLGTYLIKDTQGALYKVTYDVEMLGGNLVLNLDQLRPIKNVQCDSNNIELLVDFVNNAEALAFYKIVSVNTNNRFVTGTNWNCKDVQTGALMLMRRVLSAELNQNRVLLHTVQGFYEESIKDGSITLDRADQPQEHSKTFCLGVNSNKECDAASGPIPIYENKYFSLTCSNCFVGAKATVFLDVQISWFKLRRVATGLRDIGVNAAFVLDLAAQASWSAGFDKTYKLVDQGIIIQFFIGPIPISIWYEIPIQVLANAKVDIKAPATAGAKANWKIGDAYISWDENAGWKVVKPNPVFTWEPVLHGEANFNAEASLSIIPSFIIHAMRIVQAGVRMEPSLMFAASGDTEKKELCADLSYQVKADSRAEVHINIPFTRIRFDKTFGPYVLFDTGVKPIGHWCVKAK